MMHAMTTQTTAATTPDQSKTSAHEDMHAARQVLATILAEQAQGLVAIRPDRLAEVAELEEKLGRRLDGEIRLSDEQSAIAAREQVYSEAERARMLVEMRSAVNAFYGAARAIGNHPFIEFAGVMGEYVNACEQAQHLGVDFTQCNTHSGMSLPLPSFMRDYIAEKLECIFTGHPKLTRLSTPGGGAAGQLGEQLRRIVESAESISDLETTDNLEATFIPVEVKDFRKTVAAAASQLEAIR